MNSEILAKYPEVQELLNLFKRELLKTQFPPERTIMDDQDVMTTLKISRRRLQYMKSDGVIPFHLIGKRSYYLQSDILELLKSNRYPQIKSKF